MSVEKIRVEDFSRERFSLCVRNSADTHWVRFFFFPYLCHCAVITEMIHPKHYSSIAWVAMHCPPTLSTDSLGVPNYHTALSKSCLWQDKGGQWHPPLDDLRAFFHKQGSNNGDVAVRKEMPLSFVARSTCLSRFMIFCHLVYFSCCFVLF